MKTTVDIPDDVLKEALFLTKANTKRAAVVQILEEHNRRARVAALIRHSGSFSDAFPTNEEIEAVDDPRPLARHARSGR